MARNTRKKTVEAPKVDIGAEIFASLRDLEALKGIPVDYMVERLKQALTNAYRRDREDHRDVPAENVVVDLSEKGLTMFQVKTVVEEVEDSALEIQLDAALTIDPNAQVGGVISIPINIDKFGRIAAQTAKQVVIQGIREAERGMNAAPERFTAKAQELVTGKVTDFAAVKKQISEAEELIQRNTGRKASAYELARELSIPMWKIHLAENDPGALVLTVGQGEEASDAVLRSSEQIPGETFAPGETIKAYSLETRNAGREPVLYVSRTHPNLIRRLFELETPEIFEGQVEIRNIAREAGSRSKMAVRAAQEGLDPVGACVGPRGGRVAAVVEELHGEKVDIVVFSEDPCEYVRAALSPAEVVSVTQIPGQKACRVVVPDNQLSLAIGKEGQNARLAARLTGYKIDIKSQSSLEGAAQE